MDLIEIGKYGGEGGGDMVGNKGERGQYGNGIEEWEE